MTAEYKETQVNPGDTRTDILETLAGGQPWAFIQVKDLEDDPQAFNLEVEVGGGIASQDTLRSLPTKTLEALP